MVFSLELSEKYAEQQKFSSEKSVGLLHVMRASGMFVSWRKPTVEFFHGLS